jgi:hypothetical protein
VARFGKKLFLYQFQFLVLIMFKPYAEGKVTPKALAIVDSYKGTCSNMTAVANSACSGDGGQTRSIKRNKLKQAFLNKCEVRNLEQN